MALNLVPSDGITFARLVDAASITLNNTAAATTVTYADSVLTGTADTITLNVNAATGTINIGNATSGAGTGIETLLSTLPVRLHNSLQLTSMQVLLQ